MDSLEARIKGKNSVKRRALPGTQRTEGALRGNREMQATDGGSACVSFPGEVTGTRRPGRLHANIAEIERIQAVTACRLQGQGQGQGQG